MCVCEGKVKEENDNQKMDQTLLPLYTKVDKDHHWCDI